jgi:hypothetical protein
MRNGMSLNVVGKSDAIDGAGGVTYAPPSGLTGHQHSPSCSSHVRPLNIPPCDPRPGHTNWHTRRTGLGGTNISVSCWEINVSNLWWGALMLPGQNGNPHASDTYEEKDLEEPNRHPVSRLRVDRSSISSFHLADLVPSARLNSRRLPMKLSALRRLGCSVLCCRRPRFFGRQEEPKHHSDQQESGHITQ